MKRLAILAAPGLARIVSGTGGTIENMRMLRSDRVANQEAFAGEVAVRMPRRLSRAVIRSRLNIHAVLVCS
jgi:hypothetical protein